MDFGGVFHDCEKVKDIQPGSVINIQTNKSSYKAKSVILTLGNSRQPNDICPADLSILMEYFQRWYLMLESEAPSTLIPCFYAF